MQVKVATEPMMRHDRCYRKSGGGTGSLTKSLSMIGTCAVCQLQDRGDAVILLEEVEQVPRWATQAVEVKSQAFFYRLKS